MNDTFEQVVPEGWARVKIGDLAEFKYGKSLPQKRREPGEVPVYGSNGIVGTHTRCVTDGPAIVIGRKGTVGAVHFCTGPCWPIDTTYFVDEFRAIKPLFLTRLLQSLQMSDLDTSTAIPGLNRNDAYAQEACLPPLAEQERIATKVEALLSRLRSARQRLAAVPQILKHFRQAILARACSGKLTEEWRIELDRRSSAADEFESAVQRRRNEFDARCRTAKTSKKKLPTRPGNLDPREASAQGLPEVPELWTWVYLPDVGYMNRGKSRHRPRNAPHLYDGPYPFIQTGDIAQAGGRITEHRQTYSEAGLAQSRIWPSNTVAITIAANIANSAILTYDACFPDSVVGVIPDADVALPGFIEFFIRTAKHDLELYAPATAQKNINISILNDLAVPLPPLDEQREIVRRVESLFALADSIDQRVRLVTRWAEALTQSILARAFRGELVPTEAELAQVEDRAYESADQLLLRIGQELARRAPVKKSRRKRAIQDASSIEDKVIITVKRNLLGVLKKAKVGLSPEELFRQAGCTEDDIDGFYEKLREGIEAGQIVQTPERPDPDNPTVVLRASKD